MVWKDSRIFVKLVAGLIPAATLNGAAEHVVAAFI